MFGAPGDDSEPMLASFDVRQHQPVGVGMTLDLVDVCREDSVPIGADDIDLFDLESGQRQATRELDRIDIRSNEFIQPLQRNSHAATLPDPTALAAN